MRSTILPLALLAGAAVMAAAVQTESWLVSQRVDLAQGELHNLVLGPDGAITLGWAHTRVRTEEATLWCALAEPADVVLYGTGSGKVLRVAGDAVETLYATGEMLVTALLRSRGGVLYVATLPNGKVFRVDATGKGDLFCTLPAKYVWALAEDAEGRLFAATGPGGIVYEIDAEGKSKPALETKRDHALALAWTPEGTMLVGTASPGLVLERTRDGRTRILADFGEAEVKDLLADADGVWAAVNSGVKAAPAEFLTALREAETKAKSPEEAAKQQAEAAAPDAAAVAAAAAAAAPAQPGPVVQSMLWRIPRNRGPQEVRAFANAYLTSLQREKSGAILVSTNTSGRVFRVLPDRNFGVPLDLPEQQVLALVMRDGELAAAATGNPGSAWRIGRARAEEAAYTSDVFDAKRHSAWGRLSWRGSGRLRFSTRSGNTATADETWSEWSPPAEETQATAGCPPARYFQVRFTWADPDARLNSFELAYVPDNQRPEVQDVLVMEQPDPQALQGGPPPQPQPGKRLPPEVRRMPQRKVQWQATDPNGDVLAFRLHFRPEGGARWIPLTSEPVRVLEASWDVSDLPDGWYELKVEASDELSNAKDRALAGDKVSPRFLIDGGRPSLVDLEIGLDDAIRGRAIDEHSPIGRIDWKLASGTTWTRVDCEDGVFDGTSEEFAFELTATPTPGGDTLYVRATDAAGNVVVVGVELPRR